MNRVLFSSQNQEWRTPKALFDELNKEFAFTTDACTTEQNPLGCPVFFTKERPGNPSLWEGNVFINPPYGRNVYIWFFEAECYSGGGRGHVVMLVPARTDTAWFHKYCYKKPNVEIRFLRGRIKFESDNGKVNSAPFPSMIVIFRKASIW